MLETVEVSDAHLCDNCFKPYQRRDLLLRHPRRCLRSNKATTRQKACHSCVQAKAKCCYSQPTCSRCAKRGITCEYVTNSAPSTAASTAVKTSAFSATVKDGAPPSKPGDARPSTTESAQSSSGRSSLAGSVTDNMDSSWGSQTFPWAFDIIDLPPLQSSAVMADQEVTARSPPAIPTIYPPLTFALTTSPPRPTTANAFTGETPATLAAQSYSGIPEMPMTSLRLHHPIPSPTQSRQSPRGLTSRASQCVRLLRQYSRLLLQDDFYCPFLHRVLFNEHVPDMTMLPHTSMAICCGSGLNVKEGARYARRAMDAQRHSLIEAYPTYYCMEQWDALHAMLVYEILELSVPPADESDSWKRKPRTNGFKSPFLSKMTQRYLEMHGATLVPPANVDMSWNQWAVSETARRTIFLANIVNFFSNRNHESGRQSPYYEPLNDELILTLPLPCSHALWSARTEEDWQRVAEPDAAKDFTAFTPPPGPEMLGGESLLNTSQSLKSLFSKFTKDYIRANLGTNAGFGDSNALRSFIILCALEQALGSPCIGTVFLDDLDQILAQSSGSTNVNVDI